MLRGSPVPETEANPALLTMASTSTPNSITLERRKPAVLVGWRASVSAATMPRAKVGRLTTGLMYPIHKGSVCGAMTPTASMKPTDKPKSRDKTRNGHRINNGKRNGKAA
jgi:hypothetical protein